jgi:hypothetical protein
MNSLILWRLFFVVRLAFRGTHLDSWLLLGFFLLFELLVAVVNDDANDNEVRNDTYRHLAVLVIDLYLEPPVNLLHSQVAIVFPGVENKLTANEAANGNASVAVHQKTFQDWSLFFHVVISDINALHDPHNIVQVSARQHDWGTLHLLSWFYLHFVVKSKRARLNVEIVFDSFNTEEQACKFDK